MEITFACRAFAEVACDYSRDDIGVLEGLNFESVGCSSCLRNLRREGGGNRVLQQSEYLAFRKILEELMTDDVEFAAAVVDRHVASSARVFSIRKKLAHEVFKSETALLKNSRFPVLGKNYVLGNQG